MIKKIIFKTICIILCATLLLNGCGGSGAKTQSEYTKYTHHFMGVFDTIIQVVGYAKTQEEFDSYAKDIEARFYELSKLYDRFYEYEGINNIRTINLNAGIAPVEVSQEIISLLDFCMEQYGQKGEGVVNIALGPVLNIWHDYMMRYADDPQNAVLPPMEDLEVANKLTDISKVQIDHEAGTVFLEEKGMMLDVGAVAKGYATQLVADEIYEKGFTSFIISAGGNVVAKDPPLDNLRNSWGIGIQNPNEDPSNPDSQSVDVVFVKNQSVVSSGDYQRFYMVGDMRVHHIIDPATLMPANHYRGLTIVCDDSGLGDYLSTALFVLDYPQSRALAEEKGVGVMWIFEDGTVEYTDALLPLLRDRGGATSVIKQ